MMQHKKAQLIRRLKKVYPNGVMVEMVLWQLPAPTHDRPHGLKYRFYCGRDGHCIVRYDNEAGKGNHIHYGNDEHPYEFVNPDQLITDFLRDVERLAEVTDA